MGNAEEGEEGHSTRTCIQNGPRPLSRERINYYIYNFFIGEYMIASLENQNLISQLLIQQGLIKNKHWVLFS